MVAAVREGSGAVRRGLGACPRGPLPSRRLVGSYPKASRRFGLPAARCQSIQEFVSVIRGRRGAIDGLITARYAQRRCGARLGVFSKMGRRQLVGNGSMLTTTATTSTMMTLPSTSSV